MKTDNELIAEFMGFIPRNSKKYGVLYKHPKLAGEFGDNAMQFRYDKSWNELMPVVAKIVQSGYYKKYIDETSGQFGKDDLINPLFIERTYENVIEFIKWFNEQNKCKEKNI